MIEDIRFINFKVSEARVAGLEPAQLFRAEGFSHHYGFRRLALTRARRRLVVVWTIPSA